MRRAAVLWLPVLLVAAAISALSHTSHPPAPRAVPDWLLHGGEFATLGFTLARALAGGLGRTVGWRVAVWTLGLGAAFGVADEFHQAFVPLRHPSAADVAADAAGTAAGLALFAAATGAWRGPEPALAVTLVTGPGCGLCEDARLALERIGRRQPLAIEEVSVQESADLSERYARLVPVVLVGGEVVAAGRLDEARLAASLTARRGTGERA